MARIDLIVEGFRYSGWSEIRVTRSIESLAGSFALVTTDRWGDLDALGKLAEPWPIAEEDPCRVEINGITVIDGYVDKRNPSADKSSRTLGYEGRDRAAALVDNSAVLPKYTYYNLDVLAFAQTLAKPFDVRVSVQPGLVLSRVPKLVISPGETAYEALKRAVADEGALIVSDGAGGILITRASRARAATLVEGDNIESASGSYDGIERYYRYVVLAQSAGSDEVSGDATRIAAEAIDEGVRRKDRVLLIRPEKGYTRAGAQRRADWEARVRAARAEPVTIGVPGWTQEDGSLWTPNTVSYVYAPRLIGVDGDMLITQVDFSINDQGGEVTQLRLMRPDAFTPEPKAGGPKSSGGRWKELDKGGE